MHVSLEEGYFHSLNIIVCPNYLYYDPTINYPNLQKKKKEKEVNA